MKEHKQSQHAHISFTAHYTGEMWQKLGLSHSALATKKGKKLHQLLKPIEWFAHTFFGVSTNKTLTVRHHLIDERVDSLLTQYPNLQIIEVAAGLSPRGWRFLQTNPNLTYIEIDLPAMSELKQKRAENLPRPIPRFYKADLLSDTLHPIFDTLDTSKPLLIISEGLINYFSLDLLAQLSQIFATELQAFDRGFWITENYPFSNKPSYNKLARVAAASLGMLTKSNFSFYFEKPQQMTDFFKHNGFDHADVYQPSQKSIAENTQHLGDTVWVVEFSTTKLSRKDLALIK